MLSDDAQEVAEVVSWVHFGDLHITSAEEQNYADFVDLIEEVNCDFDDLNFCVLPGDIANEGSEPEYQLVTDATSRLRLPLFTIPGDHDLHSGSLDLYYKYFREGNGPAAYYSFDRSSFRFFFLNALEGPRPEQFVMSDQQIEWLKQGLNEALRGSLRPVFFLHCYPSELKVNSERLVRLVRQHGVLLVDMGHTHYNELANDGHTIYAATRSTGQIEEGPVGFSLAAVDGGVVSWKFKNCGEPWFALITSPADKALITDRDDPQQVLRDRVLVRAKFWGAGRIESATLAIDGHFVSNLVLDQNRRLWTAILDSASISNGEHKMTVGFSGKGHDASDEIHILVNQSGSYHSPSRAARDLDNAIGDYVSKGILGTQLGPNKNGRKW